jgi:hypothetical protein
MSNKKNGKSGKSHKAYFKHWRSGKILYAKDYGYKSWFF